MNSAADRNPVRDHTSWLLWLAGLIAVAFFAFGVAVYFCAPVVESPSTPALPWYLQGATVIANAIATPPQSVPAWLAFFYPWQALASAVFALIAALIGAWALMKQADASRRAIRDQIHASALADAERYTRDIETRREEVEEQRRQVAGAISAEIRTWLNRFGEAEFLQIFQSQLTTAKNGIPPILPIVPIFVERFPIYDMVCGKLGLFDASLSSLVVATYGALQGVLDAFKGIRSGDYDFLNTVYAGDSESAHKKAAGTARRATFGLERIIQDLDIFNAGGRSLIEALDLIHGAQMPPVPEWSRYFTMRPE